MSFNGTPIANDGTILFRQHERVSFDHLVTLTVPGAAATLRVLRGGRELECTVRPRVLEAPVPQHMHNTRPSYLIYGGEDMGGRSGPVRMKAVIGSSCR